MKTALTENAVNTNLCYQCFTCSLGCPVANSMDMLPHQVVRMVQMGRRLELQDVIWQCINCETCMARCPRGIDIPRLMDSLRHELLQDNPKAITPRFHNIFLNGIKQNGIQFELGMLIRLKLSNLDLFGDLMLGMRMLLKGKLSFIPHRIKGSREMQMIFQKIVEKTG